MRNDFNSDSYKNLELFRYYLNRDLQKIDSSIKEGHDDLFGYFIASLIDIAIVTLFNDDLAEMDICCKVVTILALAGAFVVMSKLINELVHFHCIRRKESGREDYIDDKARQKTIDEFDNISCDGLLICESYIEKYVQTSTNYLNDFYLFEIIHHLTKSTNLFNVIYNNKSLYVSSDQFKSELINNYRFNNYIDFAKAINAFLQNNINNIRDEEIKRDINNLDNTIKNWKKIEP